MKTLLTKFVRSRALWLIIFVGIAGLIGNTAYQKYQADKNAPPVSSHVIALTPDNASDVFSKKMPMYIEVCTPDICEMDKDALEQVATKYAGKVEFVTIDAKAQPELALKIIKVAAQAIGKTPPLAMPMVLLVNAAGEPANFSIGLKDADGIEEIVQNGLAPVPASPTITPPLPTAPPAVTASPDPATAAPAPVTADPAPGTTKQ